MTEKMISIMLDENALFSALHQLKTPQGELLTLSVKTDYHGKTLIGNEAVKDTVNLIERTIGEKITTFLLFDNFCLCGWGNTDQIIKSLENCIRYLKDAEALSKKEQDAKDKKDRTRDSHLCLDLRRT